MLSNATQKTKEPSLLSQLLSFYSFLRFMKTLLLMKQSRFVTVVYENFNGIRRPIGLIHKVKVGGQEREVFTFCCAGKRQPGMALFVRKRTGDEADQVALSFEDQDNVPSYLKHLPAPYREEHFKACCMAG